MRSLRLIAGVALVGVTAASCGAGHTDAAVQPREIAQGTVCALDGMLLADYPGPKAQIHYDGREAPEFFCDTVEMFNVYLKPEQVRAVQALYVQDMGQAGWENPVGHWIDARRAFFVVDSTRRGSMGPTIASFKLEADATAFAKSHGGRVVPFDGVTADKAILDGGALHDGPM